METIQIYVLKDPISLDIKYVGKTIATLNKRLSGHLQDSKKLTHKCSNWITSLRNKGLKPIIELVEIVPINEGNAKEIYWIAYYTSCGIDLKNQTLGGDGASQGLSRSKEACIKTGMTLKRRYDNGEIVFSEERRRKISEALKGKTVSDITRQKLRDANLGKKASEESKLKKSKTVYQYDKHLNFIAEYNSVVDAAKTINGTRSNISNAIYGYNRMKSYKGYVWRYEKI